MPKNSTDKQSFNLKNDELRERLPESVYYIESPNDGTVLIAINVRVQYNVDAENRAVVSWFDTVRGRSMLAVDIYKNGSKFAFERDESEGGGFYLFTPMSLEIYNKKIKEHLVAAGSFENNDDLINSFLNTLKYSM